MSSATVGFLLLRLAVGLLLAGHGAQKLFGWFGGDGFTSLSKVLEGQGFKPAGFWALLGGVGELLGGLLTALGLLVPLGEVAIFAAMFLAVAKFHWKQGLWSVNGGYEYPLVILTITIVLACIGPEVFSLDQLLHINLPVLQCFGLGVLAALIIDSIGLIISRQSSPESGKR
ncbi:DoxX family membrane protein [Ktedonosporobacter rubrisoli]|uniref:DoxX family membrane protein n=1 Tax=Ktedonosporobacter rubrisoli TaxID=2509675 RepID=A0A4P6K1B1_KTERU|nr:DoxX family membrane protein [Ktedonosporobacter rubrisoli]QBD81623.1 DoxX family membrane protein [Ktedonosporobacter rubrisoli]